MSSESNYTTILPVDASKIGDFTPRLESGLWIENWELFSSEHTQDLSNLEDAAKRLKTSDIPVAFPTETVYGLGADATRSEAVRGIYKAKQRPLDNPLIVHVCSLTQLRSLLRPRGQSSSHGPNHREILDDLRHDLSLAGETEHRRAPNGLEDDQSDPIPAIYHSLIKLYWPGPLTIILPKPPGSALVSEVTAGLQTFGARIPANRIALALIKLAGVPLAAPSANASTKPSPTAAEHVKDDLGGRIKVIIDGGPCSIGVESTVVDGLSTPPVILRPGGISIEHIRQCPGWASVITAYKDQAEKGSTPRAPGMKYRHYSPKAKVTLYEADSKQPSLRDLSGLKTRYKSLGFIRTRKWRALNRISGDHGPLRNTRDEGATEDTSDLGGSQSPIVPVSQVATIPRLITLHHHYAGGTSLGDEFPSIWDLDLGSVTDNIARGIFSALRELDRKNIDLILIEGIPDSEGHLAAAVMNRLRKAASFIARDGLVLREGGREVSDDANGSPALKSIADIICIQEQEEEGSINR